MPACCAFGCNNRSSRKTNKQKVKEREAMITFHKFPKNPERRVRWVNAIRRVEWSPKNTSIVCSEHFTEDCFDRTSLSCVRLRDFAVPSIFPSYPSYLQQIVKTQHHVLEIREPKPITVSDKTSISIGKNLSPFTDISTTYDIPQIKDESDLNYLQDDESSSSSDDSSQHHMNIGSYEFVDVNKFTETDESDYNDESETQHESQEEQFTYTDPDNAFTKRNDLQNHPHVHTGEKLHECDVCHKIFNVKYLLNRHKLTHTGEEPYECDVCYKTFSVKYLLNRHKFTHTGLNPHEC